MCHRLMDLYTLDWHQPDKKRGVTSYVLRREDISWYSEKEMSILASNNVTVTRKYLMEN